MDRADLEARLLGYLAEITPPGAAPGPGAAIFESGLFDSLALVSLVEWVEREIGRPLDPATFDLAAEWRHVSDIVAFIERERAASRGSR
jgi:hypothetical protein